MSTCFHIGQFFLMPKETLRPMIKSVILQKKKIIVYSIWFKKKPENENIIIINIFSPFPTTLRF